MGVGSPAFRSFPLAEFGVKWIHPDVPLAHPFPDAPAVLVSRSVEETASRLGQDGPAYQKLMQPLVRDWKPLSNEFLRPIHVPRHPVSLAGFGIRAIRSADTLARSVFQTHEARSVFAGLAAHAILPLEKVGSAAFGLVLGMMAHAVGWPIPRGGSQSIANALCTYLRSLGGTVVTGRRVENVDEFPRARVIVCDVTPRQLLGLAGHHFSVLYRRSLQRYRYGPGVFKLDWALAEPIPWADRSCSRAATVHLGASLEEIAASERAAWQGRYVDRPFIILAQPTLFDSTRAPAGQHTAWAYCHVPNGSRRTLVDEIESQVERFAPGFRQVILRRHMFTTATLEQHNANLVGGDINGGAQDLGQLFLRPGRRLYRTSAKRIYLCSASTPPGGGVHGMCGFYAAKTVLEDLGVQPPPANQPELHADSEEVHR